MEDIPANLLQLIVEKSPNAVAIFDNQMRYIFVNNRWAEDNQCNPDQLIGRSHYEIVPEIPKRWKDVHSRCLQGSVEKCEEDRLERSDGSTIWLRWEVRPWFEDRGSIGGILMFTEDITERKLAKDALKKANDELERRVEERTRDLARSNLELEQFAYVTSHDLQEPLRVVNLYGELLEKHFGEKLGDVGKSFISYMVESAQRMRQLISDLLTYSRANDSGRTFEFYELEQILQDALKNLQLAIKESGAEISWNALPKIYANRLLIQQLFQNLIGNAIKFRKRDYPSKVQVSVEAQGTDWTISVSDNGIGIDQRFADKIFVLFQRLHDRSEYAGTGIGLALCKKIVEVHGGKIWMKSKQGIGTTFYFTIPIKQVLEVREDRIDATSYPPSRTETA